MSAMHLRKIGSREAWPAAVELLEAWLEDAGRADALLESAGLGGEERARCQHLFFGAVRHLGRLDAAVGRLVARPPRARLRAVLLVAGFELLEGAREAADAAGHTAKVVHHAVAQAKHLASPAEARLVNAVLRKLGAALAAAGGGKSAPARAEFYSHPAWLVARWTKQFGEEAAHRLLEWNQTPAPAYARWREPGEAPPAELFAATAWADFYEVKPGHWPDVERLLADGKIYLQNPAARLAVELLAPQAGETVLDLCASPGGKSLLIADALAAAGTAPAGRVVAVDLPGARQERLKENLARVRGAEAVLAPGDVRQPGGGFPRERGLPGHFTAVLIDVPCSNTGVMRHRVDVKWRLREGDIGRHARQQAELLAAAARLVAPGGRLVYSTCSLEAEENENVVAAFLRGPGREFSREAQVLSRPWETGHDGAGAFRLRRRAD